MNLTLKNLKVSASLSQETIAFTADICIDGMNAFRASNAGTGGPNQYEPIREVGKPLDQAFAASRAKIEAAKAWSANLPSFISHGMLIQKDMDLVINEMVATVEFNRKMRAKCRKKTLFQLPGDPADTFLAINQPYSPAVKEWIMNKYPEAEIINERYL